MWLGETDPCLSRTALEDDDPVLSALHSILPLWSHDLGPRTYTAAEVCNQASGDLLVALLDVAASRRDPEKIDPKRLGRWLLKYKGRVASNLRIVKGEDDHKKVAVWKVVSADINPNSAGFAGYCGVSPSPSQAKSEKSHSSNISNDCVNVCNSPSEGQNRPRVTPQTPQPDPLADQIAELMAEGWSEHNARVFAEAGVGR